MCTCHLSRRAFLRLGAAGSVPLLAGCDVELVPAAQVEAMGLQAWDSIRRETPALGPGALQDALDAVAARLLGASGEDPADWEVVAFASPQINAFALPGRKIGVYQGMFEVTENADQLAAIVGHEIGHLQAEHGQERMEAQVARGIGMRLLSLVLDLGNVEYSREIAAALGLGVEYGLMLPYSRRQELEADRLGVVAMAEAGFAPEEAVTLWQRMERATQGRAPEFLATHPAPQSRIEAIREMLPDLR